MNDAEYRAWRADNVRYTDGSKVQEGDKIRYKQAPGGILPPSGEWRYGVAAYPPFKPPFNEELCLECDGRYYNLSGHIIEPANTEES